jgi:hypothetical protein
VVVVVVVVVVGCDGRIRICRMVDAILILGVEKFKNMKTCIDI